MAEQVFLDVIEQGAAAWNQWRQAHPNVRPDLSSAYLREADLRGYDLHEADLREAMLLAAHLEMADLRNANLAQADLRFATLQNTKLAGAQLKGAQGVDDAIMKAAAPPSLWKRQGWKPAAAVLSLLVAATLGWYVSASTVEPQPGLVESTRRNDDTVGLDRYERLTMALRKIEFATWSLSAVDVTEDILTLRVDQDEVIDEVYLPTLAAVCGAMLSADQPQLSQIRVLDRTGSMGWLYEQPANCRAVLKVPLAMVRLTVAADSKPFVLSEDGSNEISAESP